MKTKTFLLLSLGAGLFLAIFVSTLSLAGDVTRMTVEQLREKLNDPEWIVLDVRAGKDWEASDSKIRGALRRNPEEVKKWHGDLDREKSYVLYCT